MRSFYIVLIICTLAACASTPGGYLEYRPEHWKGQLWDITGKADVGAKEDKIYINVNNKNIITGVLSRENPEDVFTGNYEDIDITANCKLQSAEVNASRHNCELTIEGTVAGHLFF